MIQLYCGEGKGKTTAAAGAAFRGLGQGRKVVFAQFMKGKESGETIMLQKMEQACVLRSDRAFPFYHRMSEEQKQELRKIHDGIMREVGRRLQEGRADFVVLDEITHACACGLVSEEILDQVLRYGQDSMEIEILLTGRGPSEKLLALSDYISEIDCVRHPYTKGVRAREGIEW